jgi:hypothetical protein
LGANSDKLTAFGRRSKEIDIPEADDTLCVVDFVKQDEPREGKKCRTFEHPHPLRRLGGWMRFARLARINLTPFLKVEDYFDDRFTMIESRPFLERGVEIRRNL